MKLERNVPLADLNCRPSLSQPAESVFQRVPKYKKKGNKRAK